MGRSGPDRDGRPVARIARERHGRGEGGPIAAKPRTQGPAGSGPLHGARGRRTRGVRRGPERGDPARAAADPRGAPGGVGRGRRGGAAPEFSLADVLSSRRRSLARGLQVRGSWPDHTLDGRRCGSDKGGGHQGAGQVVLARRSRVAGRFPGGPGQIARQLLRHFRVELTPRDERRLRQPSPAYQLLEALRAVQPGHGAGAADEGGHEQAVTVRQGAGADQNFSWPLRPGSLLFATNNRWKASGEFRKTIQIDPTFAEAYKWLGIF
jgi:hypothetical protein